LDTVLLFLLGFIGHSFLGLFYFRLFHKHRLLPYYFLGVISVPFAVTAVITAIGDSKFMELISRVSSSLMIFFVFLFFLSVANPRIMTKHSQPTVLVSVCVFLQIIFALIIAEDTDLLELPEFGTRYFFFQLD